MWIVSESLLEGKHGDSTLCEDVLVEGNIFAVVDGATDKSGLTYDLKSGEKVSSGRFAALTVAQSLASLPSQLRVGEVEQAVRKINMDLDAAITEQYPSLAVNERPSCVAAVFHPGSNVLGTVGDCWVGMRLRDGRIAIEQHRSRIDGILAEARRLFHELLKASGSEWDSNGEIPDPGREVILPFLRLEGWVANTNGRYGFGVLNGTHLPSEHLKIREIPENATELVLASDGYPDISASGNLSLTDSESHLAGVLARDPLLISEYPSTKGVAQARARLMTELGLSSPEH